MLIARWFSVALAALVLVQCSSGPQSSLPAASQSIFRSEPDFASVNRILHPNATAPQLLVGINIPVMDASYLKYYNCHRSDGTIGQCTYEQAIYPGWFSRMAEIKNSLHADYVRTGWIPGFTRNETCPGTTGPDTPWRTARTSWCYEDQVLYNACSNAGIPVMILVPGIKDDLNGNTDLIDSVKKFFHLFTTEYPGCIKWAEVVNEADLPANGYPNSGTYATYYQQVASIIENDGVKVITSGTSGEDTAWTSDLSYNDLGQANPKPPVDGFGFHPYGVSTAFMRSAVLAMIDAAGAQKWPSSVCGGTCVYVTEVGESDATQLATAIQNLNYVSPTCTIYEYRAVPGDTTPQYALRDVNDNHTSLYDGFIWGANFVHTH